MFRPVGGRRRRPGAQDTHGPPGDPGSRNGALRCLDAHRKAPPVFGRPVHGRPINEEDREHAVGARLPLHRAVRGSTDDSEPGDHSAVRLKNEPVSELMPLVYDELRRIAAGYVRGERPGQTLQATALVNEAFVRMAGERTRHFNGRTHFLAIAALSMRQILIQRARARRAAKRGGAPARVTLDDQRVGPDNIQAGFSPPDPDRHRDIDILALDEALHRLATLDETLARIVELRYFGGLTIEETADVIGTSPATV